jgi:hypothetical protein
MVLALEILCEAEIFGLLRRMPTALHSGTRHTEDHTLIMRILWFKRVTVDTL